MDDPWGSPWAEEVQLEHPITIKESHETALKTQTPAKAATLALEGKTNSPWDDDAEEDEFGEWSSIPTKEEDGTGFEGTDDGWHRNAVHNEKLADHSKESAPAWRENITASITPKLAPSPMPKHLLRQHSPDPWATEITLNEEPKRRTQAAHQELIQEVSESRSTCSDRETSLDENVSELTLELQSELQESTQIEYTFSEDLNGAGEHEAEPSLARPVAPDQGQNIPDVDPLSSRPSSSPSDGSQQGEAPPESPRTSMDEDPKRPQMPRKLSSKIQELVKDFNGLAAKEEETEQIPSRKGSRTREEESEKSEDGKDDFGDFEEGHSDVEEEAEQEYEREELTAAVDPSSANYSAPQTPKAVSLQQEHASSIHTPKKFYGPVEVDLDLTILEKIYPGAKTESSDEKIFIPDTIPHDSFSSTEQRKTWYRISRYGTMRKHNSGDDENYVRVNWVKSQVRDDTLKIAARWMEEDRISGQVVLGGGSKTSSMFGWNDAKAPPVSLSSAFAPNHSKKNSEPVPTAVAEVPREWPPAAITHSSPKHRSPLSPRQRSSMKSAHISEEFKSKPLSPVANFGWNSALESKQESSGHIPLSPNLTSPPASKGISTVVNLPSPIRTSTSSLRPMPIPATISAAESPQRTPVSAFDHSNGATKTGSPLSAFAPIILPTSNQNEDDDDWGDMVSSPAITSPPVFPPSNGLRHKKSQSLMGSFPSTMESPKRPSVQTGQSAISHRSKQSFNEILVPQNQSPVSSNTSPFKMKSFAAPVTMSRPNGVVQSGGAPVPLVFETEDPWTSADFSFFDAAPAPVQTTISTARSKMGLPKSVNFSSAPVVSPSGPSQKAREDAEQNRIIQSIVKSLPDLSYMLRR